MAKVDITLKLTGDELSTVVAALETWHDEHADQAADQTRLEYDRKEAGKEMWLSKGILQQIKQGQA